MEILNEQEFTEEELIKFVGTTDMFETTTWINRGCLKKNNGTYKRLIEEAKCHAEEVHVKDGGIDRKYILKGLKAIPTVRITGNSTNKYKLSDAEIAMREIIHSLIIERYKEIEKYDTGLSVNGLVSFFGIPKISESMEGEESNKNSNRNKMIELMKDLFQEREANEYFKPNEIVDCFKDAFNNTGKGIVKASLSRLHKDKRIKIVEYKVKAVPRFGSNKYDYVAISENEFIAMKELKDNILKIRGINKNEYMKFVDKIEKPSYIEEANLAIKNELLNKFGAEFAFKSIKVTEIIDTLPTVNTMFSNLSGYFCDHFVNLTVKRHNHQNYRECTFFWRRFYLMSTFTLLESLGKTKEIDVSLLQEQKDNYKDNFYKYLFDFDTKYYLPSELKKMNGFFATEKEFSEKVLELHHERLVDRKTSNGGIQDEIVIDFDDLFSKDVEGDEVIISAKPTVTALHPRQEEMEYMIKAAAITKQKQAEQLNKEQIINLAKIREVASKRAENNPNMVDELGDILEKEEAERKALELKKKEEKQHKEARSLPFGSTFNIKPEEFRGKWDNSLLEIYSEEELEMMREEQLIENSQLEYCY